MQVRIEGLRFERDGRTVLDIPSLAFGNGTTTAIFGPNGSGKSTLLRLIAGLERPTGGAVRVGGQPAEPPVPFRRCIAYAFQEAVFIRGTVRQNLALGLELRGIPRDQRRWRIEETALECGIAHLLDRPARSLSGGEAQRANLARALCLRAPITLLDEPLAGLDRIARVQLLDDLPHLLQTFATTTILVTHDREEAFRLAEDLIVLLAGRVRSAGPKGVVYREPPDRETAELLGYTIVAVDGRLTAVPPGGLRLEPGPDGWEMLVERVVDMGNHRDVLGLVGESTVTVRLGDSKPAPAIGKRVPVSPVRALRLTVDPAPANSSFSSGRPSQR